MRLAHVSDFPCDGGDALLPDDVLARRRSSLKPLMVCIVESQMWWLCLQQPPLVISAHKA